MFVRNTLISTSTNSSNDIVNDIISSVSPQILSPVRQSTAKVLYTDESPFLYCVATAKPGLEASSFSWSMEGSSIESSTSYNIDFHVGHTGSYVYGLTQSWNSSLQMDVQTKIFTCDNVVDYDGSYQCTVSENGQSTQSPNVTLETLCKCNIFIAYSVTSVYLLGMCWSRLMLLYLQIAQFGKTRARNFCNQLGEELM